MSQPSVTRGCGKCRQNRDKRAFLERRPSSTRGTRFGNRCESRAKNVPHGPLQSRESFVCLKASFLVCVRVRLKCLRCACVKRVTSSFEEANWTIGLQKGFYTRSKSSWCRRRASQEDDVRYGSQRRT